MFSHSSSLLMHMKTNSVREQFLSLDMAAQMDITVKYQRTDYCSHLIKPISSYLQEINVKEKATLR